MTRFLNFAIATLLAMSVVSSVAGHGMEPNADSWSRSIQPEHSKDGDKSGEDKKDAENDTELTLENLYPEKRMFGPSARSAKFSADGRFAAYLYKTNEKRRHGNELWLYDFKTDNLTQLTSLNLMSKFQRSSRKVKADRIAKNKKAEEKKKKSDKGKSSSESSEKDKKQAKKETKEDLKVIESVSDKDADDEDSPRYSGVSTFEWHPENNGLLFLSEGDIYLIESVEKPEVKRLTLTSSSESSVDFLPDGSGYVYGSGGGIIYRVKFGSHILEQINPKLPAGQTLNDYALSPDGKRLVVVGSSGGSRGNRKVDVIRYRDRFAKSDSISRTVSDDETSPRSVVVYLYELGSSESEESKLIQVFETKIDEPGDVISSPKWSLDSQKVTFCLFDQGSAEVQILLAKYPTDDEIDKAFSKQKPAKKEKPKEANSSSRRRRPTPTASNPDLVKLPAKVAYQFKHYGGPNTPSMVAPDFAWDSRNIVFVSEQSGFRHVHLLDPLYESVRQLTSGNYEVYSLQFSDDHKKLFTTSTKDSAARRMVYELDLESGEMTRLNKEDGTFSNVAVSNDGKKLLANFVRYGQLTELVRQNKNKDVKVLTNSHSEKAKKLTEEKPEFFEYKNRHGHVISGMMFKPTDWKKSNKHPLLIYVYGGPLGTSHSVNDGSYSSDGYFFQMYMAKKHDYLTVVIDPRGQSGYGGLFEKSNYEQVGKPQTEDLVDGVKFLTENYNIDSKRVGIYGWSFGGFQTQKCLYTEPEVFQVGMAGAGPTQWENYNSWYATQTIGPSRKGQPDQSKYSLIPEAKNLKGKMLLIHGMEDFNVLFQDTVAVYRALLQAGKETNVELFLDPTGGHGLGGDVKRLGRARKYEEFLLRTLGEGKSKK